MPNEPGGVLWFLEEVNRTQSTIPDTGPIVVHCRYKPQENTLCGNMKLRVWIKYIVIVPWIN